MFIYINISMDLGFNGPLELYLQQIYVLKIS